jgi:inhibitor of KinA
MPSSAAGSVKFWKASDQSLLVSFGNKINFPVHERVRKFLHLLESEPIPGIRDLHPAYCSVLIQFDALQLQHGQLRSLLQEHLRRLRTVKLPKPRLVEIPVCYGEEFGPDLPEVCSLHGLTLESTIELHASVTYLVYFLGFVPGFAYLGELPKPLITPRLSTPRTKVPSGSVGIAGNQTGVYPFATPGGWRLIGRTPLAMFCDGKSLLMLGDRVRFVPISRGRFADLESS